MPESVVRARVPRLPAPILLLCLVAAAPAGAGTLYKCVGRQGETAFTSSREGYAHCTAVHTADQPTRPAAPAPKPAAAAAAAPARVEFRTAPGAATPATPSGSERARVTTGAVYKYVVDGVTHYTNRRPAGQRAQVLFTYIESCFACSARSTVDFSNVALNTAAFSSEVAASAREFGVDPALVRAIIHAESAFNPNALSNKGAQGLMQLMPATAERFGVADPFAAGDNIRGGTRYLAFLLKRFNGDARLAAAGYNAGEGAVDRYGDVPPYDETLRYVERVGVLRERYRAALATAAAPAASTTAAGAP